MSGIGGQPASRSNTIRLRSGSIVCCAINFRTLGMYWPIVLSPTRIVCGASGLPNVYSFRMLIILSGRNKVLGTGIAKCKPAFGIDEISRRADRRHRDEQCGSLDRCRFAET